MLFRSYTKNAFIYWFLTKHGIKGNLSKISVVKETINENKKIDLDKNYFLVVDENQIKFQRKEKNEN